MSHCTGWGVSDKERTDILNWIADQCERIPHNIPDSRQCEKNQLRLSSDSIISCSYCRELNVGGIDGRKTSIGIGSVVGSINAPTVFNSVFNIEQFWDGRAATLQAQAGGSLLNSIEITSKSIISKLDKDPVLKIDF